MQRQYTSQRSPSSSSSSLRLIGSARPSSISLTTSSTGTFLLPSTASAARSSHAWPLASVSCTRSPSGSGPGTSNALPGMITPAATPVSQSSVRTASVGNFDTSSASAASASEPTFSASAALARSRHAAPHTSRSRLGSSGSSGFGSISIASAPLRPAKICRSGLPGPVTAASLSAAA